MMIDIPSGTIVRLPTGSLQTNGQYLVISLRVLFDLIISNSPSCSHPLYWEEIFPLSFFLCSPISDLLEVL